MELKKGRKQGRDEKMQEDYPTSAVCDMKYSPFFGLTNKQIYTWLNYYNIQSGPLSSCHRELFLPSSMLAG